jgi:ABC-type uncharacterized transport system ATPase subunit
LCARFEAVLFLLLAFYFSLILPSEFGIPLPWHFPFSVPYAHFSGNKKVGEKVDTSVEEAVERLEDDDVKAERARIDAKEYAEDSPLIINHLRKVYPPRSGLGPKIAVRDITLAVEKGVILGLLGPNGAGKTTVISVLTGLYRATSGQAKLAGFDISTETSQVYQKIGTCPQVTSYPEFLILIKSLTSCGPI